MLPLLAIAPTMPIVPKSTGKKGARARNATTLLAVALFAPKMVGHLVQHIRTIVVRIGKFYNNLLLDIFPRYFMKAGEVGWKILVRLVSQIWTVLTRASNVRELIQTLILSFLRRITLKSPPTIREDRGAEKHKASISVLGSYSCSVPLPLASRQLDVRVTWSRVDAAAGGAGGTLPGGISTPQKEILRRNQSPMALDALALYSSLVDGSKYAHGSPELIKARMLHGSLLPHHEEEEEGAMDVVPAFHAPQTK